MICQENSLRMKSGVSLGYYLKKEHSEMGRFFIFLLPLILFISQSVLAGGDQDISGRDKIAPEISEYYRNHNFINSFSLRTERNLLAHYIPHKRLPDQLIMNKRLARIYQLMKKQYAKLLRVDEGIMNQKVLPSGYCNRSELIEIADIYRDDTNIAVKVLAYYLDYKTNMMFISKYNEYSGDKDKVPPEEECLAMVRSSSFSIQEIHKWTLFEGRWLKREVEIRLLKEREKR